MWELGEKPETPNASSGLKSETWNCSAYVENKVL